jgi:ribosomal protection tetracycline resistance protein
MEGHIPAARVHDLEQQLPTLTRGEGVLETVFDHDAPVHGEIPYAAAPDPTRSTARSTRCRCSVASPASRATAGRA